MQRKLWGPVGPVFVALVLTLITVSPASAEDPPLPEPDPGCGSIGVTIRAKPPAMGQKMPAVEVYFVRMDEDEDGFSSEELIPSSFFRKKQAYLLNAEPGRYVAVAAGLRGTQAPAGTTASADGMTVSYSVEFHYQAFFSMAMISETEVTVSPGEMVFMGDYVVSTSTKIKKSDPAQAHYLRMLAPGAADKGFMARAFTGQGVYKAEIKVVSKDPETELEFWTRAHEKVFKNDPLWQEQVPTLTQ